MSLPRFGLRELRQHPLWDFFLRTFDLGFTAFGGPPVHFQILHQRFVDGNGKTAWIDEQTVCLHSDPLMKPLKHCYSIKSCSLSVKHSLDQQALKSLSASRSYMPASSPRCLYFSCGVFPVQSACTCFHLVSPRSTRSFLAQCMLCSLV